MVLTYDPQLANSELLRFDSQGNQTSLQESLIVPRELSSTVEFDPDPRNQAAIVADVLPDDVHAGPEVIVARRHRCLFPAVIEIRDLQLNLIKQIWNGGHIYALRWDETSGLLLAVAASNGLPQECPEMAAWETLRNSRHKYPNIVFAVRPSELPAVSAVYPKGRAGSALPPTPLVFLRAQPQPYTDMGIIIDSVEAPAHGPTGSVADLVFRHIDGQLKVRVPIDADGKQLGGPYYFPEEGNDKRAGLPPLIPIDPLRWSAAQTVVDSALDASPDLAAALALIRRGGDPDAMAVAKRRLDSPFWRAGRAYRLAANPHVTAPELALAAELVNVDPASLGGPSGAEATPFLQFVEALSLYRTGAFAAANTHLDGLVPRADEPVDFEKESPGEVALRALLAQRLGRSADAATLVDGLRRSMRYTGDRASLAKFEDALAVGLVQEAELAVTGTVQIQRLQDQFPGSATK